MRGLLLLLLKVLCLVNMLLKNNSTLKLNALKDCDRQALTIESSP